MAQTKKILVTGATGKQGGAVARHLLADGWPIRALTRDPAKPQARARADQGAEVVQGDMGEPASLAKAVQGVYGVYSVQNSWTAGIEAEIAQGKALADAAKAAGVEHFVYSSVGGADRKTGIPHFDSKWVIEEHVRSLGMGWTIIRPVFFMENFLDMRDDILGGKLVSGVRPDIKLQMIAVDDIGAFVAMAFSKPEEFGGQAIELAGDELTPPQTARRFSAFLDRPVEHVEISTEDIRKSSEDYAVMVEWFNDYGYEADIAWLRETYPPLRTFDQWLEETWPK